MLLPKKRKRNNDLDEDRSTKKRKVTSQKGQFAFFLQDLKEEVKKVKLSKEIGFSPKNKNAALELLDQFIDKKPSELDERLCEKRNYFYSSFVEGRSSIFSEKPGQSNFNKKIQYIDDLGSKILRRAWYCLVSGKYKKEFTAKEEFTTKEEVRRIKRDLQTKKEKKGASDEFLLFLKDLKDEVNKVKLSKEIGFSPKDLDEAVKSLNQLINKKSRELKKIDERLYKKLSCFRLNFTKGVARIFLRKKRIGQSNLNNKSQYIDDLGSKILQKAWSSLTSGKYKEEFAAKRRLLSIKRNSKTRRANNGTSKEDKFLLFLKDLKEEVQKINSSQRDDVMQLLKKLIEDKAYKLKQLNDKEPYRIRQVLYRAFNRASMKIFSKDNIDENDSDKKIILQQAWENLVSGKYKEKFAKEGNKFEKKRKQRKSRKKRHKRKTSKQLKKTSANKIIEKQPNEFLEQEKYLLSEGYENQQTPKKDQEYSGSNLEFDLNKFCLFFNSKNILNTDKENIHKEWDESMLQKSNSEKYNFDLFSDEDFDLFPDKNFDLFPDENFDLFPDESLGSINHNLNNMF